ncbi:MAG: acyl-CoA dehydrogenase family protein [Halioglobus sp.]|nr:acyl-CoA dehydrogenase family protein [Halioglobus sp.]
MEQLDQFREDTHSWLEENCPASMRMAMTGDDDVCWGGRKFSYQSDEQKLWLDRMAEKGWTVPQWPNEYGGAGLSRSENKILQQEMSRLGCRSPLTSFGIMMLAPAMMKYASEGQKREHLPKIARGEIRWCQGYSEPGAGSDLASLQTSAVDKGDYYLVNGSKIWTSYANLADWIFCLVRTNPKVSKRDGISFLLFDMTSEGVSTAPIKLLSGASPFCQTFFDNVKVPKENLVSELNKGWTVAKYLLQHERNMAASMGRSRTGKKKPIEEVALETLGKVEGKLADPVLRQKLARFQIREQAFTLTMQRVGDEMKAGADPGPASSVLKYYGSETNKERQELNLAIRGMDSLGWEGEVFDEGRVARSWLRSKANSIEGGTSEIQLNIIAKRVLGLPTNS